MIKKTLVGLAIGCVLSTPAAFAEEYKGFYFGVWGGSGSIDMASKGDLDEAFSGGLAEELEDSAFIDDNGTRTDRSDDVLFEFALAGIADDSALDDSVSVWGVQLGYRWGKFFATEVGYAKLGEASYRLPHFVNVTATALGSGVSASDTFEAERAAVFTSAGPTISALGMLPLGERFDLHVRGGIYLADTRLSNRIRDVETDFNNVMHDRTDASETELYAGLGGAWNINENCVLRAEYQKYFDVGDEKKTGESDIDVFNISVLFK
jgi:hypothetical protein